jgi:hypothetical protein
VWQFRFNETTVDDRRCRRSRLIGTVAQYPTRADILRVVERWRLRINVKHQLAMPVTLDAVVSHYVEKELPLCVMELRKRTDLPSTAGSFLVGGILCWSKSSRWMLKSGYVSFSWHPRARPIFVACFTLFMCMPGAGK